MRYPQPFPTEAELKRLCDLDADAPVCRWKTSRMSEETRQRNQRPEHSFCFILRGLKGHSTQIKTKTCAKPKIYNFLLMALACFLPFIEPIWVLLNQKAVRCYTTCGLNILADKSKRWQDKTGWLSSRALQQFGWSDPLRAPLWSNRLN